MTEKLNGYYPRKLRRSIAKAEGTAFVPDYNRKEPITKAEYEATDRRKRKPGEVSE